MPGNFAVYETRVAPALQARMGRAPESAKEVRDAMTQEPYYQFWSAMQRRSQELMWDTVIDSTERAQPALNDAAEAAARQPRAGGSLTLDPALPVPRYHTAADIHLQPGGYHTEFMEDDASAGAVYDAALPIYIGGALGPDNDGLGRILSTYLAEKAPDLSPDAILDMGCAIGNSTLPWAQAYPQATVHAIDVAAPCLRYAHVRAEQAGVAVHFSQQNAEKTRFDDESFDVVVSHIMLHETSRSALANILAECYRVLRPGGWMLHLEIPRGRRPVERFMMEWEVYNNNETFAGLIGDLDLPAMAVQAGFSPDHASMDAAYPAMAQQHKNYTTERFYWPVLTARR